MAVECSTGETRRRRSLNDERRTVRQSVFSSSFVVPSRFSPDLRPGEAEVFVDGRLGLAQAAGSVEEVARQTGTGIKNGARSFLKRNIFRLFPVHNFEIEPRPREDGDAGTEYNLCDYESNREDS
jgi:hypothetical protein